MVQFTKTRIRKHYLWSHFFYDHAYSIVGILFLLVFAILAQPWFNKYSDYFQASLLDYEQVIFEGAAWPVKAVPRWTDLTDAERRMSFNQIPEHKIMDILPYDISKMKAGSDWRNANPEEINTYITYSVPHMGNYNLDGTEGTGSHPGVDIKIPVGTPIYAIANGKIEKAEDQSYGFGLHVVIKHPNVPDPQNPGSEVTLYSGYAHLSEIVARKGFSVNKGELIGYSGSTGMSTAPHLHFQIDRLGAPYHLYWPFSWKDVENAGYKSYFDAVRYGLNQENIRKYNVHPMNWIAQNLIVDRYVVSTELPESDARRLIPAENSREEEVGNDLVIEADNGVGINKENDVVVEVPVQKRVIKMVEKPTVPESVELSFPEDISFVPGEENRITIKVKNLVASTVQLDSTLRSLAQITPNRITASNLVDNTVEVVVKTDSIRNFKLVANGDFGEIESGLLKAQFFTDIDPSYRSAEAIRWLKDKGVIKGYTDGSFKPNNSLVRAEALKIVLLANNFDVRNSITRFSDIGGGVWYSSYVSTAVQNNIVKGYTDGTFQPGKTMKKSEFLKIAILASGNSVPASITTAPFRDVGTDAWFAPYYDFAKQHGIVRSKTDVFPLQEITRGEAAEILYRLNQL